MRKITAGEYGNVMMCIHGHRTHRITGRLGVILVDSVLEENL